MFTEKGGGANGSSQNAIIGFIMGPGREQGSVAGGFTMLLGRPRLAQLGSLIEVVALPDILDIYG